MRTFLSYVGLILVALGLILLGGDMVTSLEQGRITLHSFQTIWAMFNAGAVDAFVAWMNTSLPQWLAGGVLAVLAIPALLTGVLGVIVAFFAGHKHDEE
jgi:hypothetical protein